MILNPGTAIDESYLTAPAGDLVIVAEDYYSRWLSYRTPVYAGGYSGFGVTASRFGARLGLAALDGTGGPEMALSVATSMPNLIPPEPFRWLGAQITFRALDEVDAKGGWRKGWINLIHRMGFPL